VQSELGVSPLRGDLFIFLNRRATQIRNLFWDRDGYCVLGERSERGTFRRVRAADGGAGGVETDGGEFAMLFECIDARHVRRCNATRVQKEIGRRNRRMTTASDVMYIDDVDVEQRERYAGVDCRAAERSRGMKAERDRLAIGLSTATRQLDTTTQQLDSTNKQLDTSAEHAKLMEQRAERLKLQIQRLAYRLYGRRSEKLSAEETAHLGALVRPH
jgi:IS66 Orf2 like protein